MNLTNQTFSTYRKKQWGFTLIELMMVCVIIGILGAIAIPSYNKYVLRGKRAEGRAALLDAAALQERYYSDCNKYGTLAGANNCAASTVKISTSTETNKYNLSITLGANNQSYTLTATPTFDDAECRCLTLTQAGAKNIATCAAAPNNVAPTTNSNDCWGR